MTGRESSRAPLELRRPRDVGSLIADGLRIYFRDFRTFLAIAVAVVVPVVLIVQGVGLGQLSADYDETPTAAVALIPFASSLFIAGPLTAAMSIYAMLDIADGKRPSAASAIQRGLDVFAPLLGVMILYAVGVLAGLALLILPGIYLLVRWSFVIQATVVDGRRGLDSLRRSWELVQGSWFRVAGITLLVNLLAIGVSSLIGAPFVAAAESSGRAVYQLLGTLLSGVLLAPPAALITSLLYFDMRARKGT